MNKLELQQIAALLNDVREGLCEGDEHTTLRLYLMELYRVIRQLMDATAATPDQGFLLATLEYRARKYQQQIEERLGTRN